MPGADIANINLKSSEASDYSNIKSPHNIDLYFNECGDSWPISSNEFYQLFFNSKNCLFKNFSFPRPVGFKTNGEIKYTTFDIDKSQKEIEDMLTLYNWFYCSCSTKVDTKTKKKKNKKNKKNKKKKTKKTKCSSSDDDCCTFTCGDKVVYTSCSDSSSDDDCCTFTCGDGTVIYTSCSDSSSDDDCCTFTCGDGTVIYTSCSDSSSDDDCCTFTCGDGTVIYTSCSDSSSDDDCCTKTCGKDKCCYKNVYSSFNTADVLIKQWVCDINKNINCVESSESDSSDCEYVLCDCEITNNKNIQVTSSNNKKSKITYDCSGNIIKNSNNKQYSSNVRVRNDLLLQSKLYNLKCAKTNGLTWNNLLIYLDDITSCKWEFNHRVKKNKVSPKTALIEGDKLVIILQFSNKNTYTEDIFVRLNFVIKN